MIQVMCYRKWPLGAVFALVASLVLAGCVRSTQAPLYQGSRWNTTGVSEPEPAEHPTPGLVTVRKGDTLYRIAQTYNDPLKDLIAANGLKRPYRLVSGQKLRLPSPRYHTVGRGDTVFSVSRQYEVPLSGLSLLNEINAPYKIRVGQRLRLPAYANLDAASNVATGSIRSASPRNKPVIAPRRSKRQLLPPPSKLGGAKGFSWPVRGPVISNYGSKGSGLHNDGINISVRRGTPVRASKAGVVTYAGNELKGYGNLLLIKHADGFVTAYAHNNKLLVRRGDIVKQGAVIAEAGSTGSVSVAQVHFEIRRGRRAVNPKNYLPGA